MPKPEDPGEGWLRDEISSALLSARQALASIPAVSAESPTDAVATASVWLDELVEHLQEIDGLNGLLRSIEHLSAEAQWCIGATDVALIVLRETASRIAAEVAGARMRIA